MTFAWREHADALDQYRAAVQWDETKRPGWGDVFMDAVDAAISCMLDPSMAWGFYHDRQGTPQVYSGSVAGFPFDNVYLRMDGEVYIVAYAYERRRPGLLDAATGRPIACLAFWRQGSPRGPRAFRGCRFGALLECIQCMECDPPAGRE